MKLKYSIDQLRQVKGIGEKTIQEIKRTFEKPEPKHFKKMDVEYGVVNNIDFRQGLNSIDEGFMIVTDPPYNINYEYHNYDDNLTYAEYVELIKNFEGYPLAIIHYPEETMRYFVPALGVPDEVNVWAYNSNLPNRHHRLINYYNVKPDYSKVLQPYKNPDDPRIRERIQRGITGARSYDWFTDIQLVKNVSKKEFNHPCPVPVELMKRIILLTTEEGDLVVDPFAGSGTTAIACMETGRKFVGFELSPVYTEMANERIKAHKEGIK